MLGYGGPSGNSASLGGKQGVLMAGVQEISVISPIDPALQHTRRVLFEHFDLKKWFVMGFCAFLAHLGDGGGGFNPAGNFGGRGRGGRDDLDDFGRGAGQWMADHWGLVILIAGGVILFVFALATLLTWLSSRGKFMFLDNVIKNRAAVSEPWERFRAFGNTLFVFRFLVGLTGLGAFALIGGFCFVLAYPNIRDGRFGARSVTALLLGLLLLAILLVCLALLQMAVNDFVVPITYRRGARPVQALRIFRDEMLAGHEGVFLLYVLAKVVIAIVAGVLVLIGTCVTCCIAALPYLSSVAFLPIFVFVRSYSLYFLEQFGPEWRFLSQAAPAPQTPPAPAPEAPMPAPMPFEPLPEPSEATGASARETAPSPPQDPTSEAPK